MPRDFYMSIEIFFLDFCYDFVVIFDLKYLSQGLFFKLFKTRNRFAHFWILLPEIFMSKFDLLYPTSKFREFNYYIEIRVEIFQLR